MILFIADAKLKSYSTPKSPKRDLFVFFSVIIASSYQLSASSKGIIQSEYRLPITEYCQLPTEDCQLKTAN
jgi:hypothetical protein